MNTHGFELKSFGLEIVNDLPGYWTGLFKSKLNKFAVLQYLSRGMKAATDIVLFPGSIGTDTSSMRIRC